MHIRPTKLDYFGALAVLALVIAAFCVTACAPVRESQGSGFSRPAARGIRVDFPIWLEARTDLQDGAIIEINSANYPDGWVVAIREPVWYSLDRYQLVSGETWPIQRRTELGWRDTNYATLPLLPAARYEAANARCGCESAPLSK